MNSKDKKITVKQERFLKFIDNFRDEYGYAPSVREIAAGLGLASTSAVQSMIDRLSLKGLLSKSGVARSLTTASSPKMSSKGMFGHMDLGIPIMGRIRAGMPVMTEENVEGHIFPHDIINASKDSFFLIVEGDSMKDKGIMHGDYALIKPQKDIYNGQTGAFMVNGEITLKTFKQDKNGTFLMPANDEYPPIPVKTDDEFEIIGKFVMLLRIEK